MEARRPLYDEVAMGGAIGVTVSLLLLVVSSHLHRALRTQPDPRDGR